MRGTGPLLLLALAASRLAAQRGAAREAAPTVAASFDGEHWLSPAAPIELRLSEPVPAERGRVAVLIGRTDMTGLFAVGPDRLTYRPRGVPLPRGESEVAVYLITPAGEWRELARLPIRVLDAGGYEKAELTPRLALGNKGQLAEGHVPDASAPARAEFQDFTLNAGLTTLHVRGGWAVRTQSNFVGASNRQEALRFGVDGARAPKLDLSDYLVSIERGPVSASLGHLSFGHARHLIHDFASRGASAALRIGPVASLDVAALNGNSIVGWNNPFGVARGANRIVGADLALELVPGHPGVMHLEATALRGAVLPLAGFTQGTINDAERSGGVAFRVSAADPSQRIRLEAGYSRSRFENPADPTLAQGAELVEVRPVTRGARYADLTVELLRGVAVAGTMQASLAATLRHERDDPLYRSVAAADVRPDLLQNTIELTGALGALTVQLSHARSRDNLDELASMLETRTRTTTASAALPVGTLLHAGGAAWLPTLSYTLNRVRQFGDHVPENADFQATHVPDQVSTVRGIGVQWQGARWHAAYQLDRSDQDNRQTGRERADLGNFTDNLSLGATPWPALDVEVDVGLEGARNHELGQRSATRRLGSSLTWRFTSSSAVGAGVSSTRLSDEPFTGRQTVTDLRAELSQRFTLLRAAARSSGGQLFVRWARQLGDAYLVGAAGERRRSWSISSGATLTLF